VYVKPDGVTAPPVEDAVAEKPPNVPCVGEDVIDHVSVTAPAAAASVIARLELIDTEVPAEHAVSEVEPVKDGVVPIVKLPEGIDTVPVPVVVLQLEVVCSAVLNEAAV
jgi:hypothetical protein